MTPLKAVYVFLVNHTALNKGIVFVVLYVLTGVMQGDPRIGLLVAYLLFKALNPTRIATGAFAISNQQYPYVYGDRLKIAGETLHGIQVALPVSLPHIFVDLHNNDAPFGLQRSFLDIEKFKLEGDFGTNTTVYANHKDRIDVLKVLNPNTMRIILDVSKQYDIEIISSRLMLYSRKKIYYNIESHEDIIRSAHAVVQSLHQTLMHTKTLGSHNTNTMKQATSDRLVKFGNYSVGSIRRLLSLLIIFGITYGLYIGLQGTYSEKLPASNNASVVSTLMIIVWACSSISIAIIGFSRKKINVTW